MIAGYEISVGQVLNTGSTLRPGRFSIGIAPILFVDRGNDLGLHLNGGIGITRKLDLTFKFRIRENDNNTYFGGDLEFAILKGLPSISISTGMHAYDKLGIDGTFNLTFPIRKIASIYGCLDMDVEFKDDDTYVPVWGVIGFEVVVRRHLGIIMEIDLGITDVAENMLGVGLNVFF